MHLCDAADRNTSISALASISCACFSSKYRGSYWIALLRGRAHSVCVHASRSTGTACAPRSSSLHCSSKFSSSTGAMWTTLSGSTPALLSEKLQGVLKNLRFRRKENLSCSDEKGMHNTRHSQSLVCVAPHVCALISGNMRVYGTYRISHLVKEAFFNCFIPFRYKALCKNVLRS